MPKVIDGLDELKQLVGKEIGVSDWFTMSQELIERFADTCQDRQWIHLDVERAKAESPFGATIAHGFLTVSLLSHLFAQAVKVEAGQKMAVNYGFNRLRFVAPVPAGSRIRGRFTLQSIEEIPGGVQLTWNVAVEIDGVPKPALAAEWLGRLYF